MQATGAVGAPIVKALLADGSFNIIALTCLGSDLSKNPPKNHNLIVSPYDTCKVFQNVAKAVVGIMKNPEAYKNKRVRTHSMRLTQKQLVEAHEKVTGSKYETTVVNTEDLEKIGNDKFAAGDHSGIVELITRALWGEGFDSDFHGNLDNEKLGITLLDEAGLEDLVKQYV